MATVVLQTNEGNPLANSYANQAFANLALAFHPEYSTWSDLGSTVQGDWLIFASSFADRAWSWSGEPVLTDAGTLRFPRKNVYDLDERPLTGIPNDFRQGICEIAIAFALEPPFQDDDLDVIEEAKVDVLVVKFAKDKTSNPIPRNVIHRMSAYGSYRFGSRRLGKLA